MKIEMISSDKSRRLILLFAGWAMDAGMFLGLSRPGYDIAVAYDYTDMSADMAFAEGYDEICVVAWSLGVRAAASGVLRALEPRITLRLAVNGTLAPIDELRGIPRALFEATRTNLTERSLDKFYRRVAGSSKAYAEFMEHRPARELENVASELDVFLSDSLPAVDDTFVWDRAVVAEGDAIFAAANQLRAWEGTAVDLVGGAHLPDFRALLNKYVINKDCTATRFALRAGSYEQAAVAQAQIVEHLLTLIPSEAGRVLEVGCGTGMLTRQLAPGRNVADLEMWDLTNASELGRYGTVRQGDAEVLIASVADGAFDTIVSASTMQWFNSPKRFIRQCKRALRSGGRLVFSAFGPDNLREVAAVTGVSLPSYNAGQWRACGLDAVEEQRITLRFDTAADLFRHLRATGVNSLGRLSPAQMRAAMNALQPDTDGKYHLTYHPVYCTYTKP